MSINKREKEEDEDEEEEYACMFFIIIIHVTRCIDCLITTKTVSDGSSIDGSIATTNSISVIMCYRHQFLLDYKYRNSNTRSHITSSSVCFILCIY